MANGYEAPKIGQGIAELGGSVDQELYFCLRFNNEALSQSDLETVDLTEGEQIWMAGLVVRPEDENRLGVNYARLEDGSGISRRLRSRARREYRDGIKMYEKVGTPEFLEGREEAIDAFEKPVVKEASDTLAERNHLLLGGYIVSYFSEEDIVAGGVYFDRELMANYAAALRNLRDSSKISGDVLIGEFLSDQQLLVLGVIVGSLISRRMPMYKIEPLFRRSVKKEGWTTGTIE